MTDITPIPPGYRCGYAAIVGEPNVGKSTLMNALLGQKISIVTKKPQTTRHKILGILSAGSFQAVFLDTPGIIVPRYALHEAMMVSARSAVADADVVLFMVDALRPGFDRDTTEDATLALLKESGRPVYLVLNKVDAVEKPVLLPMIRAYAEKFPFREIFPISALKRDGTDALLAAIARDLPEHPPLYPTDIVSEQSERFFVGEIIREKIFVKCQEEVPYSTTVDIVEFKERGPGAAPGSGGPRTKARKWFISADIYVERDSQKGILIGKQGAMLKEIGALARKDIESFLEHQVFLELHVKVRERWREDGAWLERLGYKR
jgi:GTP-binding protein Era